MLYSLDVCKLVVDSDFSANKTLGGMSLLANSPNQTKKEKESGNFSHADG